jgi:hypothetical protein
MLFRPARSPRDLSLPRFALRRDEAAASVGVSATKFDEWVAELRTSTQLRLWPASAGHCLSRVPQNQWMLLDCDICEDRVRYSHFLPALCVAPTVGPPH